MKFQSSRQKGLIQKITLTPSQASSFLTLQVEGISQVWVITGRKVEGGKSLNLEGDTLVGTMKQKN